MTVTRLKKIFGIGPLGAIISFVLLMTAVWVDRALGHSAILADPAPLKVAGGALAVIGMGLYLWGLWTIRNWWSRDMLCTGGPFRWFRHPMYAAWITFILPAVALYLNSWIILLFAVLLHPIWHRLVTYEEKMMLDKFGDEYRAYMTRTGRFVPRI